MVNDYLATLELPPEPVLRQYMADREPIEAAAPKPGDKAPDFSVEKLTADGTRSGEFVTLGDFRGRHLALLFGNYTCPVFRGQLERFKATYAEFNDRVAFLLVYVTEEHPEDGWQLEINHAQSCVYNQPGTTDERAGVAADLIRDRSLDIPVALDDLNNTVCTQYAGAPERLYVINGEGTVRHQSSPGPFRMDSVEDWCAAVREAAT